MRSDPHVLVVGDPGLGKSQLLRACANVSNRGVYVCGNSTTSAGLTVNIQTVRLIVEIKKKKITCYYLLIGIVVQRFGR